MEEAYQLAFQRSNKIKTKDQRKTKWLCLTTLEPRDRVLIQNLTEKGETGKMRSYWEEQICIIVFSVCNDPDVYTIRPEQKSKGKTGTVHCNMLMHWDNLLDSQHAKSIQFKVELMVVLERPEKGFKINLKSLNQLEASQKRRI